MKVGEIKMTGQRPLVDPEKNPALWLEIVACEARDGAGMARYNATGVLEAARDLKARPDLWGGRDWPTLCREVIREDRPGWIDFIVANESAIRGLSHAEAVKLHAQQAAMEAVEARPAKGGRPKKGSGPLPSVPKGSESAARLAARIARDAPQVHERMKAGEFRSVRAAAREAGIVRDPTGLELLRKAWKRATPDERAAFLSSVIGGP